MQKSYQCWVFFVLLGVFLPMGATADPLGDVEKRGLVVAQVRCQPCHFLTRNQKRIGPGLLGVYNRAPSISGVPFKVWNKPALERWLTNPRAVKINTPMLLAPISARDRALVIAWLMDNAD